MDYASECFFPLMSIDSQMRIITLTVKNIIQIIPTIMKHVVVYNRLGYIRYSSYIQ